MTDISKIVDKLDKDLKVLRKTLRLKYPPHHWFHGKVFSAFWRLVETIQQDEPDVMKELNSKPKIQKTIGGIIKF